MKEVERIYALLGEVISVAPIPIVCGKCGNTRRLRRVPKRIEVEGDNLVTVFEAEKDDGCEYCQLKRAVAMRPVAPPADSP